MCYSSWKYVCAKLLQIFTLTQFSASYGTQKCFIDTGAGGQKQAAGHQLGILLLCDSNISGYSETIQAAASNLCRGWADAAEKHTVEHEFCTTCLCWSSFFLFLSSSGWTFQSPGGGCGWYHLPPASRWEATVSPHRWEVGCIFSTVSWLVLGTFLWKSN